MRARRRSCVGAPSCLQNRIVILSKADLNLLLEARHASPHAILGMHPVTRRKVKGVVARAFLRDVTACEVMDLETLPHKSKVTESGVNTLAVNSYLICQFSNPAVPTHVATFAHYDGVLLIQNGIRSVMF